MRTLAWLVLLHRPSHGFHPMPDLPRAAKNVRRRAATAEDPTTTNHATSKREMLRFYGPALGIFLAGPLMSNIDNAIVGRSAGTAALAALSPGTVLSDQILYLFSFMGRATTGMTSRAYARGGEREAREALRRPLASAFAIGMLFLVPCYMFLTGAMLDLLRVAPSLQPDAAAYAQIRGLTAPLALVQSVALSALLALRDAAGPLRVILFAAVLNLVGDIFLCCWPLQWGVAGAAAATSASTAAGAALMLNALQKRRLLRPDHKDSWWLDYVPPFTKARRRELFPPTTTTLSRRLKDVYHRLAQELGPLLAYAGPLSVIVLTRLAGFAAMSVTIANYANVPLLAAYQIALNVFVLFAFFAEPLSQTGQAVCPPLVDIPKGGYNSQSNAASLKTTLGNLFVLALLIGPVIASACAGSLLFVTPLVSRDPVVLELVRQSSPAVFLTVLQLTLTTTLDGAIVGSRDFNWILSCGTCTCIAQLAGLRAIAKFSPANGPITLVFATFIARLLVYFLASGSRVALGYGPLGRALRPDLAKKRDQKKTK